MAENDVVEWTKDELKNIRVNLPKGWKDSLSNEFDIEPSSIANIMSGNAKNDQVVLRALAIAQENKTKKENTLLAAKEAARAL